MDNKKPLTAEEIQEKESNKRFYFGIALIAIFAIIVFFSYVKKFRSNGNTKSGNSVTKIQVEFKNKAGINKLITVNRGDIKEAQYFVSNNGRNMAALSQNGYIVFETEQTSEPLTIVKLENAPGDYFRSAHFLGTEEIVIGGESEIGIWNIKTGQKRLHIPFETETFAVSPDNLTIAAVGREDGKILFFDTRSGSKKNELPGNKNSLRPSIYIKPDQTLLIYEISESQSRVIKYDMTSKKPVGKPEWNMSGETNISYGVGGLWLEGGSIDREAEEPTLLVYDGETGISAGTLSYNQGGSATMVSDQDAALIKADGTLSLVNLRTGEKYKLGMFPSGCSIVAVSDDGKIIVIKEKSGAIYVAPLY